MDKCCLGTFVGSATFVLDMLSAYGFRTVVSLRGKTTASNSSVLEHPARLFYYAKPLFDLVSRGGATALRNVEARAPVLGGTAPQGHFILHTNTDCPRRGAARPHAHLRAVFE